MQKNSWRLCFLFTNISIGIHTQGVILIVIIILNSSNCSTQQTRNFSYIILHIILLNNIKPCNNIFIINSLIHSPIAPIHENWKIKEIMNSLCIYISFQCKKIPLFHNTLVTMQKLAIYKQPVALINTNFRFKYP